MVVGAKKYRHDLAVVSMKNEQLFKTRCEAELSRLGIQPTTESLPILGTNVLGDKTTAASYMPKLRALVEFLLSTKRFEDSLILFYDKTPKGVVTCEDKAVSLFILSMFGKKGTVLKDFHVRACSGCMCRT
jgi:hypothetical protein